MQSGSTTNQNAAPSSTPSIWSPQRGQPILRPTASALDNNPVGEIVGLLALSPSEAPAYVGSSSGLPLAANFGEMVQSSVWNQLISRTQQKARAASQTAPSGATHTMSGIPPQPGGAAQNPDERSPTSFEPPSDELGSKMLEAYFKGLHTRYPFLDRKRTWLLHEERWRLARTKREDLSRSCRFAIFKLNILYAIGATLLQPSGNFNYTDSEVSLA